jgi:hypothetical protein
MFKVDETAAMIANCKMVQFSRSLTDGSWSTKAQTLSVASAEGLARAFKPVQ